MELTGAKAKENLAKLVEKFERESAAGKIKDYNEEATKISFIQPFLKDVLGWEVGNQDEVSPEERISRGRVDYGLKVEGKIKVFVEAKPPKADLNKYIEQAIRYGYNRKGVPFVLLTDFEELKLFDVWVKPDSRNPRKGLKIDLRWDAYLKEFDKIWLLSKESVIKGELDKLLSVKAKDRLPVDKAILDDLKRWRESLAKDIFKNNRETVTDANELKEITQRILDRIIFMRFCEDRNFVHRQPLKELFEERTETVGLGTMVFLKEEFKHYNLIFDSDLFRPKDWEPNLAIDFKVMKEIVLDTYNPYQFDVIPLEVLGNIYEQYLGYTIRLTDHQVKYELKPDVRKAGGVYYTPEYIVDYIVKNTVGKLLQELTSSSSPSFRAKRGIPLKIQKLRILDPACGSGSFLIRAYEEMLNYYKNQKKKHKLLKPQINTDKHRLLSSPSMGEDKGEGDTFGKQRTLSLTGEESEVRLTIEEKSQILREHIFGVDIDEQAVEVTKLSLMLKMLEGEFGIIPGRAILPMLDKNIRCGNSLISGSPLGLKDLFGEDFYKTKPFDWKTEFRKIMVDEGGFDAVIGNPPYSSKQSLETKQLTNFFESVEYKCDPYAFFIELGYQKLKKGGMLGFIVPVTWMTNFYYRKLRQLMIKTQSLNKIVLIDGLVFKDANVDTCLLFFNKESVKLRKFEWCRAKPDNINIPGVYRDYKIVESEERYDIIPGADNEWLKLKSKIDRTSERLNSIAKISLGMKLRSNKEFVSQKEDKNHPNPIYFGDDIKRYGFLRPVNFFNYNKAIIVGGTKNPEVHRAKPKIFVQAIRNLSLKRRLVATLDIEGSYFIGTVNGIVLFKKAYDIRYVLGLINSNLLNTYFRKRFTTISLTAAFLGVLPIKVVHLSNHSDKKLHDDLVALVDVMLDLKKKIQTAKGSQKDQIQRQIEKTDKEIDDIVYRLYDINDEEKKIIESEK
jgi:type I restriction-modification system DNA methylase subunit